MNWTLYKVLILKYKYGLFLDSYTATMLMDVFVKEKDFERAALAAHEVMLQEFNENQLTLTASLYSCFKHLSEFRNASNETDKQDDEKPVNETDKINNAIIMFN